MNKIYYNSPIIFQHFFTSVYGYKLKKIRYNQLYMEYTRRYIAEDYDKNRNLFNFLSYLKTNIPYYKNLKINKNGLIKSFKNLPFTEKEDLRHDLKNRSGNTGNVRVEKTGGTTGKSLKVYSSKRDRAQRMAYLDYIKIKHNILPFSKRASFTGKEIIPNNHKNILWRYNLPMNQILYASFKLNIENAKYVYENMLANKVETIDGFPSSIHIVAKYILLNNIDVNWDIKGVFTNAETLTDNIKNDIEKAFKTIVVDQYASGEGAPFIYTDSEKNYKLGHETGLFEFVKVKKKIYDMIVTSFINEATPIVRYKIGDRVIIDSEKDYLNSYEDEINILKILGRDIDYLVGDDNNIITSANMSNVIKDLSNKIIQSQFIQKDKNSFEINLVVSEEYQRKRDEKELIIKLNHRLGATNKYSFIYISQISKEKSGKTRFIINEMSETK